MRNRTGATDGHARKESKLTKFRKAILFALVAALLLFLTIRQMVNRDVNAPSPIAVTACAAEQLSTNQVTAEHGTRFDISEKYFSIDPRKLDMPPELFYVITSKVDNSLSLTVANDEAMWPDLAKTAKIFSRKVKERSGIPLWGRTKGIDYWGYAEKGKRWRFVQFNNGDVVGYRDIPLNSAAMFDEVIGSACFSSHKRR
jgi:hypothetical protein